MISLLQLIALTTLSLSLGVAAAPAPDSEPALVKRAVPQPQGIDVSSHNGDINWGQIHDIGVQFAYIMATEGTSYTDPAFEGNYINAAIHLIRGAYHVARPALSSGADQATYFLKRGGRWFGDGKTLPGALKLGDGCAGLTPPQMIAWIQEFSRTYRAGAQRVPVLYTLTTWWIECTANSNAFGAYPLWIAGTPELLPASWSHYTFWEYSPAFGAFPGKDRFNGNSAQLSQFASRSD